MQKGMKPGTEKRCKLSRTLLDMGTPLSIAAEIMRPMRGKSEEEKEKIAERALEEIMEAERYSSKPEEPR